MKNMKSYYLSFHDQTTLCIFTCVAFFGCSQKFLRIVHFLDCLVRSVLFKR